MKHCLIFFLAFSMLISGCATGPEKNEENSETSPLFSKSHNDEEIALGEQIHAQIMASFYVYTEPGMVAYINKIGNSLAASAKRKELKYRFTLLYNDKIYATSAPGGFVYITTGMVNFLDNEAELAAVIAHEIAQLQDKDPRLSRSRKILQQLTQTSATVGPALGEIGALAVLGLVLVSAIVENQTKSPVERLFDSDRDALNYMVAAGYDPQGLIDFLYKFLNADEKIVPYFFDFQQSRPISFERFKNVEDKFSKLPLQGKTFSAHHESYMETTKGVREIYKQ